MRLVEAAGEQQDRGCWVQVKPPHGAVSSQLGGAVESFERGLDATLGARGHQQLRRMLLRLLDEG